MPDPYGATELKRIIPEILWARSRVRAIARQYSEMFKSPTDPADKHGGVHSVARHAPPRQPLAFFMKTEGPERDPTWWQSLPNEAQRCFMKHAMDLAQRLYQLGIKGALSGTAADKYSLEKLLKAPRVNQRFTTAFSIAYDSLVVPAAALADAAAGPGGSDDEAAGSKAAESAGSHEVQAEKTHHDSRGMEVAAFRKQCEQHCVREPEARLVLLVAGQHAELKADVANTRPDQNFTESFSCMGFYDVKNAKLCNLFQGEGVILFTGCPTS